MDEILKHFRNKNEIKDEIKLSLAQFTVKTIESDHNFAKLNRREISEVNYIIGEFLKQEYDAFKYANNDSYIQSDEFIKTVYKNDGLLTQLIEIVLNILKNSHNQIVVNSFKDLVELNDNVGDKVRAEVYFDLDDRERCFIYIDDEIIWSKPGETHAAIFTQFMKYKMSENAKHVFYRLINDDIDETSEMAKHKITTGQYQSGVATYGDNYLLRNATQEEIIKSLLAQKEFSIKKIYFCDDSDTTSYIRVY